MSCALLRPDTSGSPRGLCRSAAHKSHGCHAAAETRIPIARQHESSPSMWRRVASASRRNLNRLDQNVFRGDGQSVFDQAFDVELDGFTDVLDAFLDRLALRMAPRQGGAENVVAPFLLFLEYHSKRLCHHESPHSTFQPIPQRLAAA